MLNFVDITKELSFQDKNGQSLPGMSCQIALSTKPIDFQYQASEAITSFKAVLIDNQGYDLQTITLETSLIQVSNGYHVCKGNTNYATALGCGLYYFLVNNKYQSETFKIFESFENIFPGQDSIIHVSGLYFYDSTKDNDSTEKSGCPVLSFAREYGTNIKPLAFQYKSSEAVSSFKLIELDILKNELRTINLSTSLIQSSNGYHICTGNQVYTNFVTTGLYYFVVNDKYKSKVFSIFELACPVIENIQITGDLSQGGQITVSYDAYLTGANSAIQAVISFNFSNGQASETQTINLLPLKQTFTKVIDLETSKYGYTELVLTNNLCVNSYTKAFTIIQTESAFALYDMDNIALLDMDGNELEEMQ